MLGEFRLQGTPTGCSFSQGLALSSAALAEALALLGYCALASTRRLQRLTGQSQLAGKLVDYDFQARKIRLTRRRD